MKITDFFKCDIEKKLKQSSIKRVYILMTSAIFRLKYSLGTKTEVIHYILIC